MTGHPAAPRPQDALERCVEALELLQERLGRAPAGLIAGAGAVDAAVAAGLGSSGADWVLVGPYAAADYQAKVFYYAACGCKLASDASDADFAIIRK